MEVTIKRCYFEITEQYQKAVGGPGDEVACKGVYFS